MAEWQLGLWGEPAAPRPRRTRRRPPGDTAGTAKTAEKIPADIPPEPEQFPEWERAPRRTCPACARRYAGLVAPDCPICSGQGALGLGAAGLAGAEPAAVARGVELYLEGRATAAAGLSPPQQRAAVEAAAHELRIAGLLAGAQDRARPSSAGPRHPAGPVADSVAESKARQLSAQLGATPTAATARALAPDNTTPLALARRRGSPFAHASASGHRSWLARACDPLDPLGPDVGALVVAQSASEHTGAVLAAAALLTVRAHTPARAAAG